MFIDTNVFVNARISNARERDIARAGLQRAFHSGEPVRISRQIVREYLSVVTRSQTWPEAIPLVNALDDAATLLGNFTLLEDGPEVTESLIALCRAVPARGRHIHDANIVATMLAHGEHRLLTFNTSDFRRYVGHIQLVYTQPA